jgi:Spy/CpxP family protein refolding chaperone
MKKWNVKTIILLSVTLLMATGFDALAQRGRGMARQGAMNRSSEMGWVCPAIPNLTEEQNEQILELRTAHLKEMQTLRNQVDINRAQYRALMRTDDANMSAINANIDERSGIRNRMEKSQASHHQAVRNLLTEEQRVYFDSSRRMGSRQAMNTPVPGGRGGRGAGIMRNQPPFYRGQ